jgi:transcriptional regulator with XRE-family HTH domain
MQSYEKPAKTAKSRSWDVGEAIRSARAKKGLTLRELSDDSKLVDPEGRGILPAQISRIENGAIPDLREVVLVCEVLGITSSDLLNNNVMPWFILRRERTEELLHEIECKKLKSERLHERHKHMMDKNIYQYLPLEADFAIEPEKEGDLHPGIRAYMFAVGRASQKDVIAGLDKHPGEEIVIVLDGELEFWFKQADDVAPRSMPLKAGDSIHYSSQLLHGYRAAGREASAKAIFIFTEPELPTAPQARMPYPTE